MNRRSFIKVTGSLAAAIGFGKVVRVDEEITPQGKYVHRECSLVGNDLARIQDLYIPEIVADMEHNCSVGSLYLDIEKNVLRMKTNTGWHLIEYADNSADFLINSI